MSEDPTTLFLGELFAIDSLTLAHQDDLVFNDGIAKLYHYDPKPQFLYALNKESPFKLYMVHLTASGEAEDF